MRIVQLALLIMLVARPAAAGPTMALWGDDGSGLSPDLAPRTGVPFDVVVTLDSDGQSVAAAEFVISDLRNVFPGVFAVATKKINDTPLDLGQNDLGEYIIALGGCEPSGRQIELVRITYADYSGAIGAQSALLTIRGFEAGDTQPSSFGGFPGIVNCRDPGDKFVAEMGGHENEGALCVNCFEPPANDASMGELKSKF